MTNMLIDSGTPTQAFTEQLKTKSRRRRKALRGFAALQDNAGSLRNDLLPDLKLTKLSIASLQVVRVQISWNKWN